jgi:benzoyl-CoA 2,3-epoxidase subunit B
VKRWNRMIAGAGFDIELTLPSPRFRRQIGAWAGRPVDPAGRLIPEAEWRARLPGWIPSEADRAFVRSLMQRVVEPGKMAAWIAPPERGINGQPVDYAYVRLS